MSAPDRAGQITSLASLAGAAPDPAKDPDVLMIGLIAQANARGITWAQIGSITIGRPDGKAAKKHAKALAQTAQRKLLAAGLPGLEVPE